PERRLSPCPSFGPESGPGGNAIAAPRLRARASLPASRPPAGPHRRRCRPCSSCRVHHIEPALELGFVHEQLERLDPVDRNDRDPLEICPEQRLVAIDVALLKIEPP